MNFVCLTILFHKILSMTKKITELVIGKESRDFYSLKISLSSS